MREPSKLAMCSLADVVSVWGLKHTATSPWLQQTQAYKMLEDAARLQEKHHAAKRAIEASAHAAHDAFACNPWQCGQRSAWSIFAVVPLL